MHGRESDEAYILIVLKELGQHATLRPVYRLARRQGAKTMRKTIPTWAISLMVGSVVLLGLAALGRSQPPAPPGLPVQEVTQFQFLGTTASVTPDIGHLGMTRECQTQFGEGTRICTRVEIMQTVILPDFTAWLSDRAWVQPVIVGASATGGNVYMWDASGPSLKEILAPSSQPRGINCFGWRSTSAGLKGTTIFKGLGFEARAELVSCDQDAGVACCGP